ncbi:MAG: GNAT family N-acetyltransferase [Phycisphaerae bacterium]|nr:GNAT family N-acetyltransferase [Phycisphaerae bacterium]
MRARRLRYNVSIMLIRAATHADIDAINEVDATIESSEYLHVEKAGEGLQFSVNISPRPLRERLVQANRLGDDSTFAYRQIIDGFNEGICLAAEHDEMVVGSIIGIVRPDLNVLHVIDIRVDSDHRREGLATAMLFKLTQWARDGQRRALYAEAIANNMPANQLLMKCGFDLSGLDIRRTSNHDLAREITTLFWYASLD